MAEPLRHRQTKGAANRHAQPKATAPHFYSTHLARFWSEATSPIDIEWPLQIATFGVAVGQNLPFDRQNEARGHCVRGVAGVT